MCLQDKVALEASELIDINMVIDYAIRARQKQMLPDHTQAAVNNISQVLNRSKGGLANSLETRVVVLSICMPPGVRAASIDVPKNARMAMHEDNTCAPGGGRRDAALEGEMKSPYDCI